MSLKGQVVNAMLWVVSGRGVVLFIHIFATVVLARLLEPVHFGIYGMALLFSKLATRLGNTGLGIALIQKKEISDAHVATVFTVNLVIFPTLALILALGSPAIGILFNNEEVGDVSRFLALMFLLMPFSSVARALMQKNMNFKGPAKASVAEHLGGALVQIGLAFAGFGVWSLVYGHLVGVGISTGMMLVQSKWIPKIRFCRQAFQDLFSFGIGMYFKTLIVYGSDNIDFFIVGKQLGASALGLYEKAFNLMDMTVKELGVKLAPVLFSAFSKLQDNYSKVIHAYQRVSMTTSLITFPVFVGLYLVTPSFIHVLFGEKWLGSIEPLQILCIAGFLRLHVRVVSTILNSLGQVRTEIWKRSVNLLLVGSGCWYGTQYWGLAGAAGAITLGTMYLAISLTAQFKHHMEVKWWDLLLPYIPAVHVTMGMGIVVWTYQHLVEDIFHIYSLQMLVSSVGIGVITYALGLWIFKRDTIGELVHEITNGRIGLGARA